MRIEKTKSSSSESPPYSPSGNFGSTPAAMSDSALGPSGLFLELDSSGKALFPCGRFLGSAVAGGGEVAGADERLLGVWLGVPSLPTPFPPPSPPLSASLGILEGVSDFCRSASWRLSLSLSGFFFVAFILVVTTIATKATGDGTPEAILMVHCFFIFSVLLSFQLQHAPTAMIAVRGMTRPPLVVDRFAVEELGTPASGFTSFMARRLSPPLPPPLLGLVGVFDPLDAPRSGVGLAPLPGCLLRNSSMWESPSLFGASSMTRSTRSWYVCVHLFLSEVDLQSSLVRRGILPTSQRWGSLGP